jgi:chromosome segregation ATPase
VDDYRTKQGRMEKALGDFRNAEIEIKDLGNRINMMTQERERLNNLLRSKNDDIKALEDEKLGLHSKINHYKNYENKINEGEQMAAKLKDDVNKLRNDGENWQNKAKQFENKVRDLENQLYQNNS